MADFSVVQSGLGDYFRMIQAKVHELTTPLSSEQLWMRPHAYGNSIGNLQSDEDWATPYFGELESEAKTRFSAFLRCAGHAYHHVGQIIYLQRELLAGSS